MGEYDYDNLVLYLSFLYLDLQITFKIHQNQNFQMIW